MEVVNGTIYMATDTGTMWLGTGVSSLIQIKDNIDENTTYELTKNDKTITMTGSDGSKYDFSLELATVAADGLMAADDKAKLEGIATGAEVNQSAFTSVTAGETQFDATDKQDLVTFAAGNGISVTGDAVSKTVTIASTGISTEATTKSMGYMSAADKAKLDEIEAGANKTVVDSALSKLSEDPVQNKVVTAGLAEKLDKSGGTISGTLTVSADKEAKPLQVSNVTSTLGEDGSYSDLYLQYGADGAIKLGFEGDYEISRDGGKYTGTAAHADEVSWSNVSGKPTEYPAAAHTHDDRYYTEDEVDSKLSDISWNSIEGDIPSDKITEVNTSALKGIVDKDNLPTSVFEVHAYATKSEFPVAGTTSNLYVDESANKIYRYDGTSGEYQLLSDSVSLGEIAGTAYRGDRGKVAYDHAIAKGIAMPSGLYKIATNDQGHVTEKSAVTKSDIVALGIPSQDTTYDTATSVSDGLMSAEDKTKLDGYVVDTELMFGSTNPVSNRAVATALNDKADKILVSDENNGLMSVEDKVKLDGIEEGANKTVTDEALDASSTNPLSNSAIVAALADKADNSIVTTEDSGLMTAADKVKLDGIEEGANKIVVDANLDAASANPLSNSGVAAALDKKANLDVATTTTSGLMGSADKAKLDGIAEGATVGMTEQNKTDIGATIAEAVSAKADKVHAHAASDITSGVFDLDRIPTVDSKVTSVAASKITGVLGASQLPSFVDDVVEYDTFADFPETGESGKIYIAVDTNKTYRWSGTVYAALTSGVVLGTTHDTAGYGDESHAGYAHSQVTSGNPHNVTKGDLGLDNVENKSSATIRSELTKDNVTSALGYIPASEDTTAGTASSVMAGLVKIFDSTGSATDGTITQKGITDALADKASTAAATTSAAGLMSAADKSKLDGVAEGANKTVVDTTLDSSSANPVSNSVVTDALGNKADASHTHLYAGSSSAGGSANSAVRLDTSAGSSTQPVYFSDGKPVKTTHTLGKSVPADAEFTDTHYTSKNVVGATGATNNTASALGNGSVHLNSVENGTVTSSHRISGSGATTVTADANGNIIISSTDNDTVYTHPTTSGNKHIPSGGSSGQILRWSADGTAAWGSDSDTTYSAGTGISLSGTMFSNSGVRGVSTGSANGTISVNTNGTSADVAVKGLGSAAYTASTAYAAASHTHDYLPLSGGTLTGFVSQTGAGAKDVGFKVTNTDTGKSVMFAVGTEKNNRGLYDPNGGNWMIYADANDNVYMNGTATSATTAAKLDTNAGSATQPIYFSDGKPVATTYSLNKSVPSNAVFTDTHYFSKNVVGASTATSNTTSALTNGNVYINSVENGAVTSTHKISGSGATTVTTDASGNIVISSADNDTVYTHPTTSGNKHIPSGGSSGQILRWSADGTAAWGSDSDTTYSAGTGISLSGTMFSNSGVRAISTGISNGTISVNTNGTTADVSVKGLGSAAYEASTAFAAASHTHDYLPTAGGTITGTISRAGGGSWITGRENAVVRGTSTTSSAFNVVASQKTPSGSWNIGNLGSNENLVFSYDTDTNYKAGTDTSTAIYLPSTKGGTIALTSDFSSASVNYANGAKYNTNGFAYYVNKNTTDNPYKRLAYFESSDDYVDASMVCVVDGGSNGSSWGVFKVSHRNNKVSEAASSGASIVWLARVGYDLDQFFVKTYTVEGDTNYTDLYYKSNGTYQAVNIRVLDCGGRGSDSMLWVLDSSSAARAAADIRTYTSTSNSSDQGCVLSASSATSANKLTTARTLSWTGDVTGSLSFDGSAAASAGLTIASNAVTTAKIADSNVTTAKIANSNVTTAKIADSNVTAAKMAPSAGVVFVGASAPTTSSYKVWVVTS